MACGPKPAHWSVQSGPLDTHLYTFFFLVNLDSVSVNGVLHFCVRFSSVRLEGPVQTWEFRLSPTVAPGLRVSEPRCSEGRCGHLQGAESVPSQRGWGQDQTSSSQTASRWRRGSWHHVRSDYEVKQVRGGWGNGGSVFPVDGWFEAADAAVTMCPSGRRLLCPTSSPTSTLAAGWMNSWAGIKPAARNNSTG